VSTAAILSIVSIFTSPITQQMITYKTRPAPIAGHATIKMTRIFGGPATEGVVRATGDAAVSTIDDPIQPLKGTCSSGNCTFPVYSSLAICIKMRNVTDLLTVTKIEDSTPADWTSREDLYVL